jgi:hypothetical protein
MRTVVVALAGVAILASPAHAQRHGKGGRSAAANQQTTRRREGLGGREKDYKAALDKIPSKPVADPWGGMRATSAAVNIAYSARRSSKLLAIGHGESDFAGGFREPRFDSTFLCSNSGAKRGDNTQGDASGGHSWEGSQSLHRTVAHRAAVLQVPLTGGRHQAFQA